MQVVAYAQTNAHEWDEFVARAPMATFLHTRRYLAYHGERFKDTSLVIRDEHDKLIGLFPAAVDPLQHKQLVSHPGITYGGLLHEGKLSGEKMIEALRAVFDYYSAHGFETLRYKPVPHIYHRVPSADDVYALFHLGAALYRCDLACALDLVNRPPAGSRRKRGLKKALKSGVQVAEASHFIEPLWNVLTDNLFRKYAAKPVHSLEEITRLHDLFPHEIKCVVALVDAEVVAGIVLFATPRVVRAQYIAASAAGYETNALDAIFEFCFENAKAEGAAFFDFGTSNEDEGRVLNSGLYRFKAEFGGGGVAQEFYEMDLGRYTERSRRDQ